MLSASSYGSSKVKFEVGPNVRYFVFYLVSILCIFFLCSNKIAKRNKNYKLQDLVGPSGRTFHKNIACKSKPACTFLKKKSISARFDCRFRIYAKIRVVYAKSQLRRCDMRRVMAKTSFKTKLIPMSYTASFERKI